MKQNFSVTGCGKMDIALIDPYESALVAVYDSWSGAGFCNVGQKFQSASMSIKDRSTLYSSYKQQRPSREVSKALDMVAPRAISFANPSV
jgi:hypothetical protein